MIALICIALSTLFNSLADSIAFGKWSKYKVAKMKNGVYELSEEHVESTNPTLHTLWHLVKWTRQALLIVPLLYYSGLQGFWWLAITSLMVLVVFELFYRLFRRLNVWKWDDKYRWHWLERIYK